MAALALLGLAAWVSIGGKDGVPVGIHRGGLRGLDCSNLGNSGVRVDVATPDWLARGRSDSGRDIRVAGERVVVGVDLYVASNQGASDETWSPPEGGLDGLWRISHYFEIGDSTGVYEYGSPTASGEPARPGVVACSPDLLGTGVEVAGQRFVCADTGGVIGPGTIDIWCYSKDSWGPPGCEEEWWCGLPCPAPCEEVRYGANGIGHCWALVEVLDGP